jgi:hypothetical protein
LEATSGLSLLGADILSFNLLQGSGKGLDALERICEHTSAKLKISASFA